MRLNKPKQAPFNRRLLRWAMELHGRPGTEFVVYPIIRCNRWRVYVALRMWLLDDEAYPLATLSAAGEARQSFDNHVSLCYVTANEGGQIPVHLIRTLRAAVLSFLDRACTRVRGSAFVFAINWQRPWLSRDNSRVFICPAFVLPNSFQNACWGLQQFVFNYFNERAICPLLAEFKPVEWLHMQVHPTRAQQRMFFTWLRPLRPPPGALPLHPEWTREELHALGREWLNRGLWRRRILLWLLSDVDPELQALGRLFARGDRGR